MQLSFRDLFFTLAFAVLVIAIMVIAKSILIPLSLALLLSFILHPLHKRLQVKFGNIGAAFTVLLGFFLVIIGVLTFFSAEILSLSDQLTDFGDKLMIIFTDSVVFVNENLSFLGNFDKDQLLEDGRAWIKQGAAGLLGKTFSNTASFLTGIFTMIIYTFLFLIYKKSLVSAFKKFASEENENQYLKMLKKIQLVGQKYLSGMLTLILILGLANSTGLWIIGLDNPFLFGFLAATLSIIPYIGTTIGASIPVLYGFISSDELWVPLAVAGMFWLIQVIESNFLSPKIVGNSVNVNAFAAILSLIVGASVWGVAGMVLFLPFAAMLKVICESYIPLQPLALLIGDDHFNNKQKAETGPSWFSKIKKSLSR